MRFSSRDCRLYVEEKCPGVSDVGGEQLLPIVTDSHTHTTFSADARDDMPEMCRAAIAKGLTHICFTDHVDFNPTEENCGLFDYDRYTAAIDRVRAEFAGRIRILKGIEFGEPHIYVKEYEKLLRKEFDVIMASIHFVRMDIGLHWFEDDAMLSGYTRKNLYRRYYEELLQVVRLGGFDVLAHFDNPKRYLSGSGQETELIGEIMHELVSRDLVIEVNTSPLRMGCHECAPDSRILKQYTEAGGTRVTVGSDAHSSQEIAAGFDHADRLVKNHRLTIGIFQGRRFIAT